MTGAKPLVLSLAVTSMMSAVTMAGTVTTDGHDLIVNSKGDLSIETADGRNAFAIGGRIQVDFNQYNGVINESAGETGNDIFFRRARIALKGKLHDVWKYKAQFNINEGDGGDVEDLYIGYTGLGAMANVTVGQQKEPFGLEELTSSKYITAIERAMPTNAFAPGRSVGVKLNGHNETLAYGVGLFKTRTDQDNGLEAALTGRVTMAPVHSEAMTVHVGAGYSLRNGAFESFGAPLGVRGGREKTVNEFGAGYAQGRALSDQAHVWNLEGAVASGAMHAQAEFFNGTLEGYGDAGDIEAQGWYLQGGWFLTGESRPYSREDGAFEKVTPYSEQGAWEAFARYSAMTADQGQQVALAVGEDADAFTLGLNWYANKNVRAGVNYILANTDAEVGGEDDGNAIAGRLQLIW